MLWDCSESFGNASRNPGRTPAFNETDFDLNKKFNTPLESMKIEFRAEAYNLFNTPTFICLHDQWFAAHRDANSELRATAPNSAIPPTANPTSGGQITSTFGPHTSIRFEGDLLKLLKPAVPPRCVAAYSIFCLEPLRSSGCSGLRTPEIDSASGHAADWHECRARGGSISFGIPVLPRTAFARRQALRIQPSRALFFCRVIGPVLAGS